MLCIGTLVLTNGAYDGSAPMRVEAEALDHRRSDGNLYARLAVPVPQREQVARIRWGVNEKLPADTPVKVLLKPGRPGEPWIVEVDPNHELNRR